jgi:hypothetical protein
MQSHAGDGLAALHPGQGWRGRYLRSLVPRVPRAQTGDQVQIVSPQETSHAPVRAGRSRFRAGLALEPLDRGAVALDPRLRAGRALAAEAVADDARTRPAARRLASAPACANTPVRRAGLRQSAGPASRLAPTRRSGPTICLVLASPGAYRLLPTNAVVRDGAVAITGSGVGAAALCSNSRATAARLGSGSNAVAIRVTTPHAAM